MLCGLRKDAEVSEGPEAITVGTKRLALVRTLRLLGFAGESCPFRADGREKSLLPNEIIDPSSLNRFGM